MGVSMEKMNIRTAQTADLQAIVEIYNQAIIAGQKTADISPVTIVIDSNTASIRLLEKHGFEKWGHMPGVAEFNGLEVGHLYYGMMSLSSGWYEDGTGIFKYSLFCSKNLFVEMLLVASSYRISPWAPCNRILLPFVATFSSRMNCRQLGTWLPNMRCCLTQV